MATARENTGADGSERERHGTISWTHAFWGASRVPALVLFSIGAIAVTVGNPSALVWFISVSFGFLQSFTYADIAGMYGVIGVAVGLGVGLTWLSLWKIRQLVPCHGYLVAFRTPVRAKRKARDCGMVVLMTKERNAVIGAYRRSRQKILVGRACARPWTALCRLTRGAAIASATRLATNARRLAEYGNVPVTGH